MANTLCLNMIVKNEVGNLRRCLDAVAAHIGAWVIVDTGSTDGTPEFIRAYFRDRGIPGELHAAPFIDFAQARNEALSRARHSPLAFDYLLLCDADMELVVEGAGLGAALAHDLYHVKQRASGLSYWNVRLVRRGCSAVYRGVTHEFIGGDGLSTGSLEAISFIDHATGSSRPEKHERDARLLRAALESEPDPGLRARYVFYLANTLREAGDIKAALALYEQRADLGHWQEEIFVSLFRAAQIRAALGQADDAVIAAFERASSAAPRRAEALHGAAQFCRSKGLHARAYDFAKRGMAVPYPRNGLFVQDWVYAYGLLDEFAVSACWTGHYAEGLAACQRILEEGHLPAGQRRRIEANAGFARARIGEGQAKGQTAVTSATDIERLRVEIAVAPDDAALWYRLGEACRAAGRAGEAMEAFDHCARSKSDPLRAWSARLEHGRMALAAGKDSEFVALMLAAYDMQPGRAEPLHELARHFRQRKHHAAGLLFAEEGLRKPIPPAEARFVDPTVYAEQLQSEYAILAYYSPDAAKRRRGFAQCEAQALGRGVSKSLRDLARRNVSHYAEPLASLAPSAAYLAATFEAPQGYHAMNPSIASHGGALMMLVRCVNYRIENGRYVTAETDGVIRTRNFLLAIDADLAAHSAREVRVPPDLPSPAFSKVRGFEDLRLIPREDGLWASATVRELDAGGVCQIVLSRIDLAAEGDCVLTDWRVLPPGAPGRHEKNWTPILDDGPLRLIYSFDPAVVVDGSGQVQSSSQPDVAVDHFRGGTQAIPFRDGFLAVIHETVNQARRRQYLHRFVLTDGNGVLRAASRPFYFKVAGIEFAAGLAWHPDGKRLVISFGVEDAQSWLGVVEADEVAGVLLSDPTELPPL